MKYKNKIILLVVIQVSIILASFLSLVFFESEKSLLGNAINISGKTRFLTMKVHETIDEIYISQINIDPLIHINNLESNITILKSGGQYNRIFLDPLPLKFESDWNQLKKTYDKFHKTAIEMINLKNNPDEFNSKYGNWEDITDELVDKADILTTNLAYEQQLFSENLMMLQILLLITNILFHLLLITIIIRLFKKESNRIKKSEKFATIGELSSRIAHDLRNPLSIIKIAVDLIQKKEDLNPQILEKTKMINTAISRMSHQINDVMDYVKTSPLNLTKNIIEEIIKEALEYSDISKTIIVEFTENQTEIVCDKEKIFIVLVNLFRNANEAMKGTGKLTIKIKSLPQNIQIVIENSGPSILTTNLDSIFTPLFTTNEKGTGLGLATCKNIISEHNGNIFAFNHPTRFVINIPQKI